MKTQFLRREGGRGRRNTKARMRQISRSVDRSGIVAPRITTHQFHMLLDPSVRLKYPMLAFWSKGIESGSTSVLRQPHHP